MDSPSHVYSKIPYKHSFCPKHFVFESFLFRNISSFSYDQASIIERLPTRNILVCDLIFSVLLMIFFHGQKLLQDTADDIRNYIIEQRVQIETKTILLNNPKILIDRVNQMFLFSFCFM
jgi:hypothetical protein